MVKKSKVEEVEEIDESYYSESSGGVQSDNDDIREIDAANIGNYTSDSESEEGMLDNI
jgi:hypothetical protein